MCKAMEDLRNESYAEGREEGRESQAKDTAVRMSKKEFRLKKLQKSLDSVQTRLRNGL